jgi:hypothetical protein
MLCKDDNERSKKCETCKHPCIAKAAQSVNIGGIKYQLAESDKKC